MDIEFPDKYAIDSEGYGIVFPVIVDNNQLTCVVKTEALQDIDPNNRMDTPENQFNLNKFSFQEIAEEKIKNGDVDNNKIIIDTKDVI